MADVKISALTAVVTPATSDVFPVVQGGVTKQETVAQMRTVILPASLTADVSGTLPVANGGTGITSLGAGVATFLGTPSGANLASALSSALPDTKGGTGLTALGTGIATFLGTPSSANLAAAITDETGTGSLVFQTSPTFKTSIILNNPANTFAYTFTPAAIAAARTITLPLLTAGDTMVCEAFTQTLTNKTIVAASNTITDTSAALGDILRHDGTRFVRLARGSANQVLTTNGAGTDIAWAAAAGGGTPGGSTTQVQFNDAGAFAGDAGMTYDKTNDVLTLAGAVVVGTTPAGAGSVRLASAGTITERNAANSDDIGLIGLDASDELYIGSDSAFTPTKTALYTDVSSRLGTYFRISGTTTQLTDASFIKTAIPTIGYGAPYGSHGAVTYAFASNANYTLTAAEYVYDWISFNVGAWTAGRTVTFPNVASLDAAYTKTVFNNTGFTMTISNGGTTKTLATGLAQRFLFGVSAVSFASPTWTP